VTVHRWFCALRRRVPVGSVTMRAVAAVALAAVALAAEVGTSTAATPCGPPVGSGGRAGPGGDAAGLTRTFDGGVDGLVGADYQRTVRLPDGRVLWFVQDAVVTGTGGRTHLVHNAGILQRGPCFTLLRGGPPDRPAAWLAPELTTPYERWFWPLGSALATDGTLRVLLAEMHERGDHYLARSEPVATWMVTLDSVTLAVLALGPAPDASAALYGWSVASDRRFTFLFSHCHRQFGFGLLGHDPCTAEVRVARLPRGELDGTPQYWDGHDWVDDPVRAVNVAPTSGPDGERRVVNPMQFAYANGRWLAVTKEGDWWGTTVYLDRAARPTGPWTTASRLRPRALGDPSEHNTYFASVVAVHWWTAVVGLSNNRWDGRPSADYRPTFVTVPLAAWGRPRRDQR